MSATSVVVFAVIIGRAATHRHTGTSQLRMAPLEVVASPTADPNAPGKGPSGWTPATDTDKLQAEEKLKELEKLRVKRCKAFEDGTAETRKEIQRDIVKKLKELETLGTAQMPYMGCNGLRGDDRGGDRSGALGVGSNRLLMFLVLGASRLGL